MRLIKWIIVFSLVSAVGTSQMALAKDSKVTCTDLMSDEVFLKLGDIAADFVARKGKPPKKKDLVAASGLSKPQVTSILKNSDLAVPSFVTRALEERPEIHKKLRDKLKTEVARFIKDTLSFPKLENLQNLADMSASDFRVIYGNGNDILEELKKEGHKFLETALNSIVRSVTGLARSAKRIPTMDELSAEMGVDAKRLQRLIESGILGVDDLEDVVLVARQAKPNSFKNVMLPEVYNVEAQDGILKAARERQRLMVISVISGAPVNKEWFQSLLTYCKHQDAEILVIPEQHGSGGSGSDSSGNSGSPYCHQLH